MNNSHLSTLIPLIDRDNPDRFRDALDTVEDFLSLTEKNEIMDYCIQQKRFEETSISLLAGADANLRRQHLNTPVLVEAVSRGQVELAMILLLHHADPNAVDTMGNSAVHYAARRNLPAVIGLLERHGADLSLLNHENEDAFVVAARNESMKVWHALEEAGASPANFEKLIEVKPSLSRDMQSLVDMKTLQSERSQESRLTL